MIKETNGDGEELQALAPKTPKEEYIENLKEWCIERIEDLMESGESGPELAPLFCTLISCYTGWI